MSSTLAFSTTSRGFRTVKCGDINLYSTYDPEKEASRFIGEAFRDKLPLTVVILGAGLGYLEKAVKQHAPQARRLAVYYAEELYRQSEDHGDASYHPQCTVALSVFFETNIDEYDTEGLEIIEWPACAHAFPESSKDAYRELYNTLRRRAASLFATLANGRRWLQNALVNFLCIQELVTGNPLAHDRPVVIAASGPSLKTCLPFLRQYRNHIDLWALPSSLGALKKTGLVPDVVVATDAGHYASVLLESGRRNLPLLAMPISGARGAWRTDARVFVFCQTNFFEQELFAATGVGVPEIPVHGTVAGSALFLAACLGASKIVFCGLDCCFDDIMAHVEPHPFSEMLMCISSRLAPFYSLMYARAVETAPERVPGKRIRISDPLAAYADSFRLLPRDLLGKTVRLNPSLVDIQGLKNIDPEEFKRIVSRSNESKNESRVVPGRLIDADERKAIVRELCESWIETLVNGKNKLLKTERIEELFDGGRLALLVRFFAGPGIMQLKRDARLTGNDMAVQKAEELLEKTVNFLKTLCDRLCPEAVHA